MRSEGSGVEGKETREEVCQFKGRPGRALGRRRKGLVEGSHRKGRAQRTSDGGRCPKEAGREWIRSSEPKKGRWKLLSLRTERGGRGISHL